MEGPGLLGRGGRPACDYPMCLLARLDEVRRGVLVHKTLGSTIRRNGEHEPAAVVYRTELSDGDDGGVP